jgi:hypothetical protein
MKQQQKTHPHTHRSLKEIKEKTIRHFNLAIALVVVAFQFKILVYSC